MSDEMTIVEKLRTWAHDAALQDSREHSRGLNEAAREIERLSYLLVRRTDELNSLKDAAILLRMADEDIWNAKKSTRELLDRLEEAEAALDAIIGFKFQATKNKEER